MVKIYLLNSYFTSLNDQNITGSDKFAIDLIKKDNLNHIKVFVIGPKYLLPLIKDLKVSFLDSGNFRSLPLVLAYVLRTFKSIFILMKIKEKGIILSCSDFFSDVIPAFLFCKKFNWYAFSYHLYPKKISLRSLFGRFLQFFSYLLFNYSSKVFVTNQICENFLKKNFRIKNLKKISLGIDLGKFFGINKSQKVRENLLFLGRFKESKGFFEIPEILLYLNKNNPNFFLNLIGSGSESDIDDFMKKIQEYKLESKVSIHTKLSDFEVLNFLQTSNILIHPSFEEGFSLAICEALASNLKVCAYNLPIYKEIYSDFGIVTCATHNTKSFAKNIEKCLKSSEKTNYPQEYFEDFDFDKTYNLIFN